MEPWQLIVLLGAFAMVGALAVPRRTSGSSESAGNTPKMQLALEQFMENMEADNRDLVDAVTKLQQQQRAENASRDERTAALERRCIELENRLQRYESNTDQKLQALHAGSARAAGMDSSQNQSAPPVKAGEWDGNTGQSAPIRDRYAELFELHRQGKPIDAIAKRLGMNKGEVMLILQLSKQEGTRHAE